MKYEDIPWDEFREFGLKKDTCKLLGISFGEVFDVLINLHRRIKALEEDSRKRNSFGAL